MRPQVLQLALAVTSAMFLAPALADVVELKTGGRIAGTVEKLEEGGYRITTPAGTVIQLDRNQVSKVDEYSAEERSYAGRSRTAPDTVEGQLALAKWCREHNLGNQAQTHAQRVIELDPTNAEARQMLNFRNVDGAWMTREQVMASRGLVWFDGKYRTRQEIALREREEKIKQLDVHWTKQIKKWRRWLGDRRPERTQEALREFEQLTDPMAAPALVELLEDEQDPAVRRLLAKTAARIDHQATVNVLVTLSLSDPDEELRLSCLESLIDSGRPGLTEAYIAALRSNDNAMVNRAGMALRKLEDSSAVGPLIDALVTKHKRVVGGGGGGGDTYSFNPSSGGFSMGGGGPKLKEGYAKNPDVLGALVRITGERFGYDEALWEKWHASQAQLVQVDLRRDN